LITNLSVADRRQAFKKRETQEHRPFGTAQGRQECLCHGVRRWLEKPETSVVTIHRERGIVCGEPGDQE